MSGLPVGLRYDARVNVGRETCPCCPKRVGIYLDFEGGRRYREHVCWIDGRRLRCPGSKRPLLDDAPKETP